MWLAAGAASLSLILFAASFATPDRAAALIGRPQKGIAAALAREGRQVLVALAPRVTVTVDIATRHMSTGRVFITT